AAYFGRQYLAETKPKRPPSVPQEVRLPISTVPVLFTTLQPDLTVFGDTVAGRTLDLRSLVAGEVVETGPGLRDGSVITAGDMLLKIDPFDFEGALISAEASLAEATARASEIQAQLASDRSTLRRDREQLKLAQTDLERAQKLVGRGTVSRKLVDDRRLVVTQRTSAVEQRNNGLQVTQARLEQQKAAIKRGEWTVRQAKRRLEQTILRAPFDAYVQNVEAEVGRVLNANDRVAQLIDRNAMDVRFTLSDAQFGRIVSARDTLIGSEVVAVWQVGPEPLRYPGVVERIGATIDSRAGGVQVLARLTNPLKPQPLRPGAFIEVKIKDRSFDRVVRLPQTALYGSELVYAVEDDRLAPRKVALVGRAGSDVLVRGALEAGERVLTTRLSAAGAGVLVNDRSVQQVSKAESAPTGDAAPAKPSQPRARQAARAE
ncbi:MAG: efflux RND transporter periplasmic adaptor subunit, partial [Pseudomonadota bacterium]